MGLAVKVGWALFVAASILFVSAVFGYFNTGFTSVMLFLLSGLMFSLDFVTRKMKPWRRSKIIAACIIIGIFLLFFGPDVRTGTLPNGQNGSWICNGNDTGCSGVTQLQSVTEHLWCWGTEYNIALPPSVEFMVTFGCAPTFQPMGT
jgi:hypothetical protein